MGRGIETAKGNESGEEGVTADGRKIDQVVEELDKHKVVVGVLQETEWFVACVVCSQQR